MYFFDFYAKENIFNPFLLLIKKELAVKLVLPNFTASSFESLIFINSPLYKQNHQMS